MARKRNKKVKKTTGNSFAKTVLDVFIRNPFNAYNFRQLSSELGISDPASKQLVQDILASLSSANEITEQKRGKYKLNPKNISRGVENIITGIVDMKQTGKAYIISETLPEDVFIASNNTYHALNGDKLLEKDIYKTIDQVIPIPLHRKKLKQRGFNQAELFARGLAKSMKLEIDTTNVYRAVASTTQTKKGRYKRWENVSDIFKMHAPEKLKGKHVLLVDDVITTGATMEACLQALSRVEDIKLSVASIAFASH